MATYVASWDFNDMIQAFLRAPSYHIIFEVALIVWIVSLLFKKSYKLERTVLSEKEKEELLEEWQPEPLVPDVSHFESDNVDDEAGNSVVYGKVAKTVNVDGVDCINMASWNFLGMVGRENIEDEAVKALRKYGVGSCGPRGFYGTVDTHIKLEHDLAEFMRTEEAIIYSFGFATVASAIPAYSKRGDIIFCDEGVSLAIQKGLLASRSIVKYFKHNDVSDLERLLEQQAKDDLKNPKKAKVTRRFMIVEGLYMNYGDICPLPELVALKWKYKVRIFVDETVSFGTLGDHGRGVTEHYGIPIDEVDLICASLETSLGAIGGFCCGKAYVVDHQRLSGLGYCFSASQPPMLATAANCALHILQSTPELLCHLHDNCKQLQELMSEVKGLQVVGESISPIKHLYLANPTFDRSRDKATLQKIVQYCRTSGVAYTLASYLEKEETFVPPPSIRVAVNCQLTKDDIQKAVTVLEEACQAVIP